MPPYAAAYADHYAAVIHFSATFPCGPLQVEVESWPALIFRAPTEVPEDVVEIAAPLMEELTLSGEVDNAWVPVKKVHIMLSGGSLLCYHLQSSVSPHLPPPLTLLGWPVDGCLPPSPFPNRKMIAAARGCWQGHLPAHGGHLQRRSSGWRPSPPAGAVANSGAMGGEGG